MSIVELLLLLVIAAICGGIVQALIGMNKMWSTMGYQCQLTNDFRCPLILHSKSSSQSDIEANMMLLINIQVKGSVPYRDFAKSVLVGDEIYDGVVSCMQGVVCKLQENFPHMFQLLQHRKHADMVDVFIPQISKSLTHLVGQIEGENPPASFEDLIQSALLAMAE